MKIGILQTGHVATELEPFGTLPTLFEQLLAGQDFEFAAFPVVDGVFPDSVTACDGWLLTGSKHGTYDDLPWIAELEDFIRAAFEAGIPMVGVCFGHQIIAQALGGKVEKFAGGWSVGATEYTFLGQPVRQNAWHQDQVVAVPENAEVIATNDFCENAALVYGDKAFTVQWHPEFDGEYINGLINARGRGVVPDALLEDASARLDLPVANDALARQIGQFFRERRVA